jgi:protein O-mannosyl-transferase
VEPTVNEQDAAHHDPLRRWISGNRMRATTMLLCAGLVLVVAAVYGNHFQNEFHFDDSHTITANPFIRTLRSVPRFFVDTTLSSTQPGGRMWRPLVSTSLAIDYWLGRGLKPFFFHLSTFCWFAVQLVLMFFLFRRIMESADPHSSNIWTAWLATACYGLHPANAETVNYIIQRADLYSTLGVVASVLWFAARPESRRRGWYLVPAVAAYLSKAPALIFPLILLAYLFLVEEGGAFTRGQESQWQAALRRTVPAFVLTAAAAILTVVMTPATFSPGAQSASLYRLTQPWVSLYYFRSFFLPTSLSADSDRTYVSGALSEEAVLGYLFVAALAAACWLASKRRQTRPIAFGIAWFILALLPTALMPLAEVSNDHRMFFAFVGLALAVVWALRLLLFRLTGRLTERPVWIQGTAAAAVVVLAVAAAGTRARNQVWRTEESLWRDVSEKSPGSSRGVMNYATVLLTRGDFKTGLPVLQRAAEINPYDFLPEMNLGVAYGNLGQDKEAAHHFERAVALAPDLWEPHFYYGRWLESKRRLPESQAQLEAAVRLNPLSLQARSLLMQVYEETGNNQALDRVAQETLQLADSGEAAKRYAAQAAERQKKAAEERQAPAKVAPQAAEDILRLASQNCHAGKYDECLDGARRALQLKPEYPEAYNVMAMALIATNRGDDGIEALRQALRIRPDYPTAQKNLDWALQERRKVLGK